MTAYLLTNHLLNFLAPAAMTAVLLVMFSRLFARFFKLNNGFAYGWLAQSAINFVVGVIVVGAGQAVFGADGKMLTYLIAMLAMAASQWCQLRGWTE